MNLVEGWQRELHRQHGYSHLTAQQLLNNGLNNSQSLLDTHSRIGAVIAMIDSRVDYNNQVQSSHLWRNPAEQLDGLDNDGNGFIDDLTGWDFVGQDPLSQDEQGHGTEMAGLVLQQAPAAQLMPLRVVNNQGIAGARNIADAIRYATSHHVTVINISLTSKLASR